MFLPSHFAGLHPSIGPGGAPTERGFHCGEGAELHRPAGAGWTNQSGGWLCEPAPSGAAPAEPPARLPCPGRSFLAFPFAAAMRTVISAGAPHPCTGKEWPLPQGRCSPGAE